jgi:cytochrome P450
MTVLTDPVEFFGAAALQDPYPLYDRMHAEAPVHRIGDSVFYAVCGWDAVIEAIERVGDFSPTRTATMVGRDDGSVTPFDMGPPSCSENRTCKTVTSSGWARWPTGSP